MLGAQCVDADDKFISMLLRVLTQKLRSVKNLLLLPAADAGSVGQTAEAKQQVPSAATAASSAATTSARPDARSSSGGSAEQQRELADVEGALTALGAFTSVLALR